VMGFTPNEVSAMSVAEYLAAVDGWNRANGASTGAPRPMSASEYHDLLVRHGYR